MIDIPNGLLYLIIIKVGIEVALVASPRQEYVLSSMVRIDLVDVVNDEVHELVSIESWESFVSFDWVDNWVEPSILTHLTKPLIFSWNIA